MKLKTYFNPSQVVCAPEVTVPSLWKIEQVVNRCMAKGLIDVIDCPPATVKDLLAVHDERYVNDILQGRADNGFGNRSLTIATAARHSVGSFVAAARGALEHGITFSPTQGFHHAGYDSNYGYCTFNGLALAAYELVMKDKVKVAIFDGDGHFGDGTEGCLHNLPVNIAQDILHIPAGGRSDFAKAARSLNGRLDLDSDAVIVFEPVKRALADFGAKVVLYQAGADAHIDDPYGAGYLSTSAFHWRDRMVFTLPDELGIAVCFNLAGGYQQGGKVVDLHAGTVRTAAELLEMTTWRG